MFLVFPCHFCKVFLCMKLNVRDLENSKLVCDVRQSFTEVGILIISELTFGALGFLGTNFSNSCCHGDKLENQVSFKVTLGRPNGTTD